MKRTAAVVTDRGGRTCHTAIVSRALGIPAIVWTGTGTAAIHTGDEVTVSCVNCLRKAARPRSGALGVARRWT
jgi:pyruvate, water dikinase